MLLQAWKKMTVITVTIMALGLVNLRQHLACPSERLLDVRIIWITDIQIMSGMLQLRLTRNWQSKCETRIVFWFWARAWVR